MRRRLAGLAVALLVAGGALTTASATAASWNDVEVVGGGFTAMTVPPPIITACTASNVLGSFRLELKWRYASTTPTPNAEFFFGTSSTVLTVVLAPSQTTTTGPVGGVYTTTFNTNLLNGAIGGTGYAGIRAVQSGWYSTVTAVRATFPPLIGEGTCTVIS